jgi:hypothetical protein
LAKNLSIYIFKEYLYEIRLIYSEKRRIHE